MNPEDTNPNPTPEPAAPQAAQQAPAVPVGETVPTTWPGALGLYNFSKAAIKFNLASALILFVVGAILGVPNSKDVHNDSNLVLVLVLALVSLVVTIASYYVYIASVRQEKISVGQAVKKALDPLLIVKAIVLFILCGFSVVLGFILLIIPGFIVLGRLSLASYFLVDKKMGIIEAYTASWNATKGHVVKALGIMAVMILFAVASLIIIGLYFSFMYAAAFAVLYQFLLKTQPANSITAAQVPEVNSAPPQV